MGLCVRCIELIEIVRARIEATPWLRMRADHCSVTTIAIDRTGAITIRAFGDTAHMNATLLD